MIYYFQTWNKKGHNIFISRVMYIQTPYITIYIETPYISMYIETLHTIMYTETPYCWTPIKIGFASVVMLTKERPGEHKKSW